MELDVESVNRVGGGFVDAAEELSSAASKAKGLGFTGVRAGREYAAEGTAMHESVQRMTVALEEWAAGSRAFGESVHGATARVVDTDSANAANIGGIER